MNFAPMMGQTMGVRTVAALGTVNTDATSLTPFSETVYRVTGADAAKGVRLPKVPPTVGGKFVIILNVNAAILKVYPPIGGTVDGGGTNAAFAQGASASVIFYCDKLAWHSISSTSGGGSALTSTLTSAHLFVGNGSNVATDVPLTGDVAITNAGLSSIATGITTNLLTTGVAAGYKVARGITALDGTNPTPVATGLTTVLGFAVALNRTTAVSSGTAFVTYGAITGGSVDVYGWVIAGSASAGTENVAWVAVGT